jgi:hypothetical protein
VPAANLFNVFVAEAYITSPVVYVVNPVPPAAVGNVWFITVDETSFTYNLRRLGSATLFSVRFDLTKPIDTPPAPWGWVD